MNKLLTYEDISFVLNYIYDFKENFNLKTCFVISGDINHFKKILTNYLSNKNCKTLFCIINNYNHWTFLTILKKNYYEIYYFDSLGNKINSKYLEYIKESIKEKFIFFYNNKIIQKDNYSCGYYCMFLLIVFDIILNIQNQYSSYILYFYVKKFFFKDKFFYFLNKYKIILNNKK